MAKDEGFRTIIRSGSTVALPEEAHSVRVELDELGPQLEFSYRFKAGNDISRTGRTRTTPPGNAMVESVTFAFVSCQNFPDGYFTPYAEVANAAGIEAVIHLGDYIYEEPASVVRAHAPLQNWRRWDELDCESATAADQRRVEASRGGRLTGGVRAATMAPPNREWSRDGASAGPCRGAVRHVAVGLLGPQGAVRQLHAQAFA